MGCCIASPQPKPNKTCKKACVVPPRTGWDAWHKASVLWWPCADWCFTQQMVDLPLHLYTFLFPWSQQIFKSPNICVLHKNIVSEALQCSSNSWQCPRICGCQHGRQHQTVLWSLSITSCHGFVVQVPLSAVLAAVGLCSCGKHLETNGWCRIQWVWKHWSKYQLILLIPPFTAPKILTRLEWAARPVERLCGDCWCSILNDLVTTIAHKQPREWLCSSGARPSGLIQNRLTRTLLTSWNS